RPRQRPPAPAGGEHRAWHDQPLAGAEGGAPAGHRFRRAVLADPGADVMSAMLRLLGWMLAVALVALPVVAVVNGWVGAEQFPLRTRRVQGELQRVDEARLRATVLPHARRGFFAVELDRIQAAVGALPWVERAEVRKHWPDVLE